MAESKPQRQLLTDHRPSATVTADDHCNKMAEEDTHNTVGGDHKREASASSTNQLAGMKQDDQKIKVHFVAVGSAPMLKRSKFKMNADDEFMVAISFLRKLLKLTTDEKGTISPLFIYVNSTFMPAPDERIGDLFDCFAKTGELVLNYSLQEAWG